MRYVELHCKSNFSFLEGASHPDELVTRAAELGYAGLAITDRASVAGVVRGFTPAKELGLQYVVGTEIHPRDAPPLVLWPIDRAGYGRMTHLISRGRMRAAKGSCELWWDDIVEFSDGLIAGVIPQTPDADDTGETANRGDRYSLTRFLRGVFRDLFADRGYLLCELHRGVDDATKVDRLQRLSLQVDVPLVACGDVHYHSAERMLMHDCVTAIRHGTTIDNVHHDRFANSQRHLTFVGGNQRPLPQGSRCVGADDRDR